VKAGDLVRILATGSYGIVLDEKADIHLQMGLICRILTPNTGYHHVFWDELEFIDVPR